MMARGGQRIVVSRRIGVFRGEAGVYGEDQGAGPVAQHPHLAIVGLEIPADKTAAVKIDQHRIRGVRFVCGPIAADGVVIGLPLFDGAHLFPLTAQQGRGWR